MTDSTDKKSKETHNQDNQHESLPHRPNSIDKNQNEISDDFNIDLDALQNESDSSSVSFNESQDDEDAIDRLLMNASFDSDDSLIQTEMNSDVHAVKNVGLHDELDDFLDFGGFRDNDVNESEKAQDDKDALEMLVMNAALDADCAPEQVRPDDIEALEDVDSFSDFSDFVEPDIISVDKVDHSESGNPLIDDAKLPGEIDDFLGLIDDFDESDLIQDDEVEASPDKIAANEDPSEAVEELVNDVQDDENSFNNLFADADFGEEDALVQAEGKDEFGDDEDLSDEIDDFSVQAEDAHLTETEKSSAQNEQEDDFLLPDFDITADTEISGTGADAESRENEYLDAFGDTDFLNENEAVQTFKPETLELKPTDKEEVTEPRQKQTVNTGIEDVGSVKLSPFEFEQEDFKKQLEHAENKFKKAKRYSYLAMGFGAVALSAAAGLGVITYEAKTEVSRLTEAVTTLEANLAKSAANSPSEEVDAMRNSLVLLNKQVDGFITELKGNSQFPTDLLNNKVPNIVAKQDMVSKALDMLQVKVGNLQEKVSSAPSVIEPHKVEVAPAPAPVKEDNEHEVAPAKIAPEHEQAKNIGKHDLQDPKEASAHGHAKEVAMHEPASIKKEAAHEQTPTKENTTHEAAPVKSKPQPEPVTAKPVVSEKIVVEEKPVKVIKQAVIGKWGVNLVAFKQEWFAKSKAAEFARLGVFAEVIPVHEKNITMYRLRVGGFKSKAEANSNTAKIKQALNLDSVWVSDN